MARGFRVDVALVVDRLVTFIEKVELKLRGAVGAHLLLLQPRDLSLEHCARRMRHVVLMVIEHVGQHQRGAVEPRQAAQRRHVGFHDEVAVAFLPARRRVAGHRLHVDVVCEQIIAAVRLLMRTVAEEFRLEALADQAPLHVHHGNNHGVDRAGGDGFLQVAETQIARHLPLSLRHTRFSMNTLNGSGA